MQVYIPLPIRPGSRKVGFSATSTEITSNAIRERAASGSWTKQPNKQINNVGLGAHFYFSRLHDKTGIKEQSKKGVDPTRTD
jgi:hypothetical protein